MPKLRLEGYQRLALQRYVAAENWVNGEPRASLSQEIARSILLRNGVPLAGKTAPTEKRGRKPDPTRPKRIRAIQQYEAAVAAGIILDTDWRETVCAKFHIRDRTLRDFRRDYDRNFVLPPSATSASVKRELAKAAAELERTRPKKQRRGGYNP